MRGRGVPLQYIIGSQPFGDLDIKCARGVLIPRWETEEWTLKLAQLLQYQQLIEQDQNSSRPHSQMTVVDLCTGTGCIPLSLASKLRNTVAYGVDISQKAVKLFKSNIKSVNRSRRLDKRNSKVIPAQGDISIDPYVFCEKTGITDADIVTANPPYIGRREFFSQTERSVRLYEPHQALLGGLEFYRWIYDLSVHLQAKGLVCEVGNAGQIDFMRSLGAKNGWSSSEFHDLNGHPRAVVMWKDPSWSFLEAL
ncbi:Mtq1p [Sugiyamaella lignohabitans]|uniref:Mtq1p n=1 Tax=Sugiyamaella lignohabitans TaxID=796027 RepID=A0A167E8Q7_9ASCO|nr:Mtq1p [Sugiyamaella lignohabitans]ANB13780.1 Mtq1p [Sugiyamaella lignohabitans]